MFVMIADITLKEGADEDFARWFAESNKVLRNSPGFISRKLLKSSDGSYRILVEHQSKETFIEMHNSPEHQQVHPTGHSFMSGEPQRKTYTVAAE